ncbi:DUF6234 family protein [Kitasatospora sp. NBC_01266]|uniref:DUF6234 family protein n=1 Tax=Kitasatospora sp. NBC_01266 TaxID=2903572 RepID=UPI002E30BD6E|nr:DUF6234 family protein [Kitasatospora sp. NBC_01266]
MITLSTRPAGKTRRRWPLVGRAPLAVDVPFGILLSVLEAAIYVWQLVFLRLDMLQTNDFQVTDSSADAYALASLAWTHRLLLLALAVTVLAAVARAPWSLVLQLTAVMALGALLSLAQNHYDRAHPPKPVPYTGPVCYSGSRCS